MTKLAIVQCADTGPLESVVFMLRAAGYECAVPGPDILSALRPLGGLVLSNLDLQKSMGYDPHFPLRTAGVGDMNRCALYLDVKAHQTHDRLVEKWPNLRGKVAWYRINGGEPEHVIRTDGRGNVTEDCGDEVNPPCPVITPNQWYASPTVTAKTPGLSGDGFETDLVFAPRRNRAYAFWPPFVGYDRYSSFSRSSAGHDFTNPVCLIHNVNGWGYKDLVEPVRSLGVEVFGRGSPDGLIGHGKVPGLLRSALAMVHLKSNDAPGYALYEAMAVGCPLVLPRRLVWRCRMQELFESRVTYLPFDRETHDPLTSEDVVNCSDEIEGWFRELRNPAFNREVGEAGRERLKTVMWERDRDLPGFADFLARNFP